jgi:hypothetical protein
MDSRARADLDPGLPSSVQSLAFSWAYLTVTAGQSRVFSGVIPRTS